MDVAADSLTIILALRRFSKRFADGRGWLGQAELALVTGLESDALARCLSQLTSESLITSAMTDEHLSGRRLFYLTRASKRIATKLK